MSVLDSRIAGSVGGLEGEALCRARGAEVSLSISHLAHVALPYFNLYDGLRQHVVRAVRGCRGRIDEWLCRSVGLAPEAVT